MTMMAKDNSFKCLATSAIHAPKTMVNSSWFLLDSKATYTGPKHNYDIPFDTAQKHMHKKHNNIKALTKITNDFTSFIRKVNKTIS